MKFGSEICAKGNLKQEKLDGIPKDPELLDRSAILHFGTGKTYTFLGVPQSSIEDEISIKNAFRFRNKCLIPRLSL